MRGVTVCEQQPNSHLQRILTLSCALKLLVIIIIIIIAASSENIDRLIFERTREREESRAKYEKSKFSAKLNLIKC
jgi:hypothetical protein